MHYLHTMIRVSDPDATIAFFNVLGLHEVRRIDSEQGRFTLIFLATPEDAKLGERRAEVEQKLVDGLSVAPPVAAGQF